MNGKSAYGLSRVNSTVYWSTALVPPGERTPLNCERRARAVVRVEDALDARDHVFGLEGAAVVERDALAQVERPHVARLAGRPALGELGLERVVVVEVDQVLEELVDEDDAALVVDGERVGVGDRRRADELDGAAHDRARAGRSLRRSAPLRSRRRPPASVRRRWRRGRTRRRAPAAGGASCAPSCTARRGARRTPCGTDRWSCVLSLGARVSGGAGGRGAPRRLPPLTTHLGHHTTFNAAGQERLTG